jgi:hypothetical protein
LLPAALVTKIKIGRKWLEVTNSPTHNNEVLITTINSFTVLALGVSFIKLFDDINKPDL